MKVLVGLSGGIDSSTAAYLLKEEGYDVEGITMLTWKEGREYKLKEHANSCYCPETKEDLEDIERICSIIGIKHRTIDCSDIFENIVLNNFRSEYKEGRTPNPCIWCNRKVKFGAMVEEARKYTSFDFFATGHYARIDNNGRRYELKKALDLKKDQTYFLSRLSQEQLSGTLFPLGNYTKEEIRKIDVKMGFHEEGAGESQDFYSGDYADILNFESKKGNIILSDGTVLGEHNGYWNYTIGQRKGLGISYPEPLYVIKTDPTTNTVIVGKDEETHKTSLDAKGVNYVSEMCFEEGKIYTVKIRSAHSGAEAYVKGDKNTMHVDFLTYVRGVTPGQSAVVYDEDRVIASGFIV